MYICIQYIYMYMHFAHLPRRGLRGSWRSRKAHNIPISCSLSLSELMIASTSQVNNSQERWGYLYIHVQCTCVHVHLYMHTFKWGEGIHVHKPVHVCTHSSTVHVNARVQIHVYTRVYMYMYMATDPKQWNLHMHSTVKWTTCRQGNHYFKWAAHPSYTMYIVYGIHVPAAGINFLMLCICIKQAVRNLISFCLEYALCHLDLSLCSNPDHYKPSQNTSWASQANTGADYTFTCTCSWCSSQLRSSL